MIAERSSTAGSTDTLETTRFDNTQTVFKWMNRGIENLIVHRGIDLIPHMVLSHGFMEWSKILFEQFPCLAWRGPEAEKSSSFTYEQQRKFLYERFFNEVANFPSLEAWGEDEVAKLKEDGWRAFLED